MSCLNDLPLNDDLKTTKIAVLLSTQLSQNNILFDFKVAKNNNQK